jgi:branched-chain amino acid transport system ATP-binding protein
VLEVTGVSASHGDFAALHDVTVRVGDGEIVALVGSNGAGKTTLLRVIVGLLRPRAGAIRWDGEDLRDVRPDQIVERGLVLVPEGRRLFARMSVLENLELGAFTPRARRAAREALERVYALFPVLRERRSTLVGALSGGQQQMVAVGRALMASPRLLVLDEPSLGVAPRIVEAIFRSLVEINRAGVGIFLVEQNVHAALTLAGRAYLLEGGRVVREGSGATLLADDEVRRAYLGPLAGRA